MIPSVSSSATAITRYSVKSTMGTGLAYTRENVTMEIYRDPACQTLVASWPAGDSRFAVSYAEDGREMDLSLTESGLREFNESPAVHESVGSLERGYSGCTLQVSFEARLGPGAVCGDEGNTAAAGISWTRTNASYDSGDSTDCHVHTWGLAVSKTFEDGAGDYARVKMLLRNEDGSYVRASEADGVYTVEGSAPDEAGATALIPTEEGKITVCGLREGTYTLTETETDEGYARLEEPVPITISRQSGFACPVCGGLLWTASATVKGESSAMVPDSHGSANALVPLRLTTIPKPLLDLPDTGYHGPASARALYLAGMLLVLLALALRRPEKRRAKRMQ